jgi:thiamine kinase-like enzyme
MAPIKIGEGKTPEEKMLETAVNKIADWHGKDIKYERILAGFTNLNWKVYLAEDQKTFFLKIPGPNTEIFIDRELAHDASVKAAASGYAPAAVHYIEEDEIEVYEFLEEFRSCNIADMLDSDIRKNIIQAYKAVHSGDQLIRTKTGFDQIDEHARQTRDIGAHLPPDLDYFFWQTKRVRHAIEATGFDLSACYNDGYVTNYMVDAHKNIKIIDWEYAANNDPVWDLAIWSIENFFDDDVRQEMIEEYYGKYEPAIDARITLYRGLVAVKWGLWAALQAKISTIPFDYTKYSDILFMRGRAAMREWRWEQALQIIH